MVRTASAAEHIAFLILKAFVRSDDEIVHRVYATPPLYDPPQIPLPVNPAVKEKIEHLLTKKERKFRDFVDLKSGYDAFSRIELDELIEWVGPIKSEAIFSGVVRPHRRSSALRWFLRGLPPDDAIRKVNVDTVVEMNARGLVW